MLDVISPADKIGYVQGLNNMVMNFGMAFAPWLLGLLADAVGTNPAIWTGVAISFLAALINLPLMFRKGFGGTPKKVHKSSKPLPGEEAELVEKVLRGEYVPQKQLDELNKARAMKGDPAIIAKVSPYEEDKERFDEMRQQALETFGYRKARHDRILAALGDPKHKEDVDTFIEQMNTAIINVDPELKKEVHDDLGKWFADYLEDNGYAAHAQSLVIKQMIASAFPTITHDEGLTEDNIEEIYLRARRVTNQYLALEEEEQYSHRSLLGRGMAPVYFS
jgi:hypothetical protein